MLQKHGDAMGKLSPKISVTITDHFSCRVEQSVSCARVCVCLRTDNNLNSVISLDPVWVRFSDYSRIGQRKVVREKVPFLLEIQVG